MGGTDPDCIYDRVAVRRHLRLELDPHTPLLASAIVATVVQGAY
ncbi:hypothetical protein [Brevibacillus massiliensis]|nr:hypothetical protein [Brevibacillus massiliensis]